MKNKRLRKAVDFLLCLVFPRRCYLCGKVIPLNERFCGECDADKERVPYPSESVAMSDKSVGYRFERLIAPFYFSGCISRSIYLYKFKGYFYIAEFLADEMYRAIEREYTDESPDYVICVPSSKKRKRERGFNQGVALAKSIAEKCGSEYAADMLVKIRETPPQRTLTRKERLTNLKDAFGFSGKYDIKNKTVMICDDVKTTGSTFNECADVLLRLGAERVICVAAALSDGHK